MDEDLRAIIARITDFLGSCGNVDIEAGIGQIYGLGAPEDIEAFETKLAAAIRNLAQG